MQKGFYFVRPVKHLMRNEIVIFYPPKKAKQLLIKNNWSPKSGLLIKHVMAIPDDTVCYQRNSLWINHKNIAPIYHFYAKGKRLPQYHFCGRLPKDEYLLISTKVKKSFDSRYFGPINKRMILGRATRL